MDKYIEYNNVPLISCVILSILSIHHSMDMARLSLLTTLLMNKNLSQKLTTNRTAIRFSTFIKTNRIFLETFNQQYYALLPHLITSLSILLDMNGILIKDNLIIINESNYFADIKEKNNSRRLADIIDTIPLLSDITSKTNTVTMFNMLRVEL